MERKQLQVFLVILQWSRHQEKAYLITEGVF